MPRFLVVVLSFLTFACETNEVYRLDISTSDIGDASSWADVYETSSSEAGLLPTGAPCTEDAEERCFTGFCLTTEFVKALDPRAEVPGGACSKLGCTTDEECGPSALCLTGIPDIPISLCLPKCKDFMDCRYLEGYVCFGHETLGEIKVCLPGSVAALFLCGDGVCDPNEQAHPDFCKEDCK